MSENYTSGIQRLLKISKQESLKIGHSYVGSEHLLLAIIKDSKGSASNTLIAIGCNVDKMKLLLKTKLITLEEGLKKLINFYESRI